MKRGLLPTRRQFTETFPASPIKGVVGIKSRTGEGGGGGEGS